MFKFLIIFALGAFSYKVASDQNLIPASWEKKVTQNLKVSAQEICKNFVQK